tara:strand:- start:318 stop:473 length:156 start_codon:yes stop_codon:yes gene_type:complete
LFFKKSSSPISIEIPALKPKNISWLNAAPKSCADKLMVIKISSEVISVLIV